jgi:hypothetical protein
MKNLYFPLVLLLVLGQGAAQAQTCYTDSLSETAPASQFVANSDGTATDTTTGLMWMRCSLGQTWDGDSSDCGSDSDATALTWQAALAAAESYGDDDYAASDGLEATADYSDWRLPNSKELISITEASCYKPAINATIFPDTKQSHYWSGSVSASSDGYAWATSYSASITVSAKVMTDAYYIRLVRDL